MRLAEVCTITVLNTSPSRLQHTLWNALLPIPHVVKSSILQLVAQLSRKNEQLVLRSAKVSEEEMAAVTAEFQQRIAALEKKVGVWGVWRGPVGC